MAAKQKQPPFLLVPKNAMRVESAGRARRGVEGEGVSIGKEGTGSLE